MRTPIQSILLFALILVAVPRAQLLPLTLDGISMYRDEDNLLRIYGSVHISSNYIGFPRIYDLTVRELYIQIPGGSWFPLSIVTSSVPVGDGVYTEVDQPWTYARKRIEQRYRHTASGKEYTIQLQVQYNKMSTKSYFSCSQNLTWHDGVPQQISGYTVTGTGPITCMDWDAYSSSSGSATDFITDADNYTGSLAATEDHQISWANPNTTWRSPTNSSSADNQTIARLYDTQQSRYPNDIWELYFISQKRTIAGRTQHPNQAFSTKLYQYPAPVSILDNLNGGPVQTITYGGGGVTRQEYPGFVREGDGNDHIAFMASFWDAAPVSGTLTVGTLFQWIKLNGRSIKLSYYYHDDLYSNIETDVDDGNSVTEVLQSLLPDANSVLTVVKTKSTLTCPGNDCDQNELYDLEYSKTSSGDHAGILQGLRTAAFVLKNDQYITLSGIPVAGVVFSVSSRAFISPKGCANGTWKNTMAVVAHELGHTFGFKHQWSNCAKTDMCGTTPWCCTNGTIESYSDGQSNWANYNFNYHEDSKKWFRLAPLNWIQPYFGACPGTSSETIEPHQIINWVVW